MKVVPRASAPRPQRTAGPRWPVLAALAVVSAGCDIRAANTTNTSALLCPSEPGADAGVAPPVNDALSATRRLRRMTLALTDRMPTRARLRELDAFGDVAAQKSWLDSELERLLADPLFYDSMVEFGHNWMNIPPVGAIADAPEYGLVQQRAIVRCPDGTLHAGKWSSPNGYADNQPCNGLSWDGTPTVVRSIEPGGPRAQRSRWWG